MVLTRKKLLAPLCATALVLVSAQLLMAVADQAPQAASSNPPKPVGTVKVVTGNAIILTTDAGPDLNVLVQENTRMVRTAPGQKDLKDAVPMRLPEVQVGDRMVARGVASADNKSLVASSIIVMTRGDVAQKQQRDREDWQKRGTGGLVNAVDVAGNTITLATTAAGASKTVAVRVSNDTIVRRYAPDSVKFDDATKGTLNEIRPGDQLRARGTRSADGSELTAEEIVSGTFRNISGVISAIDPESKTISLTDLATKKPVVVKITAESQVRKLSPFMAQGIAARLKGGAGNARPGGASDGDSRAPAPSRPTDAPPGGDARGPRPGGGGDVQQMLNRLPAATLADLQKGDAVMMVTTQGAPNSPVTAITLLGGVEPILTASQASSLLTPWNLSGGGGEGEAP